VMLALGIEHLFSHDGFVIDPNQTAPLGGAPLLPRHMRDHLYDP
jgi:hypothetical protein